MLTFVLFLTFTVFSDIQQSILQELVRTHGVLNLKLTRSMLFQMFFSMYACREQLALRHYDVKLLNFFVAEGSTILRSGANRRSNGPLASCDLMEEVHSTSFSPQRMESFDVTMHVAFGDIDFALPFRSDALEIVKLSDFGTSSVGTGSLGDPITVQQFTTLENTPPEYLILGSSARQAYSADTFCLGLSMLHLLSGYEPYEVLLEEVKCPQYLVEQLSKIWFEPSSSDVENPYSPIFELVQSLDPGEEAEAPGTVLFDTLYRYLILFSGREDFWTSVPWTDNPVWGAVLDSLGIDSPVSSQISLKGKSRRGRRGLGEGSPTTRAEAVATFQHDRAQWSVHSGTHPTVVQVRTRLNDLGGDAARQLFDRLTHFDPARRCKMHDALLSPIFAPLRIHRPPNHEWSPSHTSYTAYRRPMEQGGTNALHTV